MLAVTVALSQYGCSKSGSNTPITPPVTSIDCTGSNPSFASDVLPIINASCATSTSCHAAGSTTSGGPFTSYSLIAAKASDIKSQVQSGAMPKTGSITAAQKKTIICWVSAGAANN